MGVEEPQFVAFTLYAQAGHAATLEEDKSAFKILRGKPI